MGIRVVRHRRVLDMDVIEHGALLGWDRNMGIAAALWIYEDPFSFLSIDFQGVNIHRWGDLDKYKS